MSKNTSIALGEHWQAFIEKQVSSGRYGSASEFIRNALRLLEQRDVKIETLRAALVEGEASGSAGRSRQASFSAPDLSCRSFCRVLRGPKHSRRLLLIFQHCRS